MSWRRITIKFPGSCVVCGKEVEAGKPGLWAKGEGVKHEDCVTLELACAVCGGPAGCPTCEHADTCDIPSVSQACICGRCGEGPGALKRYLEAAAKNLPAGP
ncbi:MAG: hypothetical protein MPJ08_03505 [Nitrosopumilus sp.]|nr:hypothetical protein [Nitrosopumilus sp.]